MNSNKRRHTPTAVELSVLSRSKRRCALCFALTGDLTEKHGQIAHLDHNPANWAEDNLAFLCLNHHSVYDSTTSQHKNYTLAEVKKARDDLYAAAERDQHTPAPPKVYETQSEEAFASRHTKWYKDKKYLTGSIILPVMLAVFGWIYNYQNSSRTESITNSRPSNSITSAPSNTGIITQGQNGNITINQSQSQPIKPSTARIDLYHFRWHQPTKDDKFAVDVFFQNRGALPGSSFRRSDIIDIRPSRPLDKEAIDQFFTQLYSDIATVVPDQANEIQPGQPNLYYKVTGPLINQRVDENTWAEVEKGSEYIYVISLLQYKDERTPLNKWITTESCVYRSSGNTQACGSHNRIIEATD